MAIGLSPEALARRSARRPWLTIVAWVVAVIIAVALIVALLGSALTTDVDFINTPESERADNLLRDRFYVPKPSEEIEIVLVRSPDLTVEDPVFRDFVEGLFGEISALGPEIIPQGTHYYQTGAEPLVSFDPRTTGLIFTLVEDPHLRGPHEHEKRERFFAALREAQAGSEFEVHSIRAPGGSSRAEIVIVRSSVHTVDDGPFRQFVEELFFDIAALGRDVVWRGITYYGSGEESLVSADRHTTMLPFTLWDDDRVDRVQAVVDRARHNAEFEVLITGRATFDKDFLELALSDLTTGEFQYGLPAAAVVLVLVFGALVAAIVPLALAFVSIIIALGLAALVGQAFDLSIFSSTSSSCWALPSESTTASSSLLVSGRREPADWRKRRRSSGPPLQQAARYFSVE